ncbi:Asp23/Gls24 family envelope stress response protein [Streptomyces sp. NPDC003952]
MTSRIPLPDTPPPFDPDDEQLPCGRLLSEAWTAWEDTTTDTHQKNCPHCTAAVAELAQLETAVRALREDTDDPDHYDTTPLTERIMDVVRLELRPGRPLPLGEPDEPLWVMESAAARVLRTAAERVPGVRSGSCRITPGVPATGPVTISLHILAPSTAQDLPALAHEVRRTLREAADRHLGLDVAAIDVHVVGLADEPDVTPKGLAP